MQFLVPKLVALLRFFSSITEAKKPHSLLFCGILPPSFYLPRLPGDHLHCIVKLPPSEQLLFSMVSGGKLLVLIVLPEENIPTTGVSCLHLHRHTAMKSPSKASTEGKI